MLNSTYIKLNNHTTVFNQKFSIIIDVNLIKIKLIIPEAGKKGDWDFRISDLVKNPDGTET